MTEKKQSANARRQAAFKARQREAGRTQRVLWLTDEEVNAVKALLDKMRGINVRKAFSAYR